MCIDQWNFNIKYETNPEIFFSEYMFASSVSLGIDQLQPKIFMSII